MKVTKKTRKQNPAQMARAAVDRVFAAMLEDREFWCNDNMDLQNFDNAIDVVAEAIEAEEGVTDATDNLDTREIGVRAGYLIGVQVGLRLRNVGGGA